MYLLFVAVTVLVGLATFASGVFGLLARSNVRQRPGRGQAVAATARLVAGPLVIILPLFTGDAEPRGRFSFRGHSRTLAQVKGPLS